MKFTAIVFLRLSSQKNKQTKKRKNFICESSFEAAVFITANKVKDSLVIFFQWAIIIDGSHVIRSVNILPQDARSSSIIVEYSCITAIRWYTISQT